MDKHCFDTDGRMYFTVTAEGRGLQKRRYYFSETFAAIGCAEYYKATGDENAFCAAERYFDIAYKCYSGEIKNQPKFNTENSFVSFSAIFSILTVSVRFLSIPKRITESQAQINDSISFLNPSKEFVNK